MIVIPTLYRGYTLLPEEEQNVIPTHEAKSNIETYNHILIKRTIILPPHNDWQHPVYLYGIKTCYILASLIVT